VMVASEASGWVEMTPHNSAAQVAHRPDRLPGGRAR
jgi:hypothetical protein